MDFQYTPEQEAFRRELRGWLAANLPLDWATSQPEFATLDDEVRFLIDWQRRLASGGWSIGSCCWLI